MRLKSRGRGVNPSYVTNLRVRHLSTGKKEPARPTIEVPTNTKIKYGVKLFWIPVKNSTVQDFIVVNKCTSPKKIHFYE